MRALSIRQPDAEEILRGVKTIEYRTRPTAIIGERFSIDAGLKVSPQSDLDRFTVGGWRVDDLKRGILPQGVIVGSAIVARMIPPGEDGTGSEFWGWALEGVERIDPPIAPVNHPQPSWFIPF